MWCTSMWPCSAQWRALHHDIEALGECRAYTDSLQKEPFILPHFHIQHLTCTHFHILT